MSAEVAPWSKTGGLGDVVGGLPIAMAQRGHRVFTIAPRYDQYSDAWDTTVTIKVQGEDGESGSAWVRRLILWGVCLGWVIDYRLPACSDNRPPSTPAPPRPCSRPPLHPKHPPHPPQCASSTP